MAFLHSSLNFLNFFCGISLSWTGQLWDFYVPVERKTSVIYGITRHWPSLSKLWNLQKLFSRSSDYEKNHSNCMIIICKPKYLTFHAKRFFGGLAIICSKESCNFQGVYFYVLLTLVYCIQTFCTCKQFIISCSIVVSQLNAVFAHDWHCTLFNTKC